MNVNSNTSINTSNLGNIDPKEQCQKFLDAYPELKDGAVITKLEISGCQGHRRTKDIQHTFEGLDISDQSSVSKSEVRWIDSKALSFKSTINSKISTLCARLCINYSNMFILPVSSMQEFLEEAQKIESEFKEGISNALDNYEIYVENEKKRSPLMADLIDKLKLTKDDFGKSFKFRLANFIPFTPISVEESDETNDRYKEQLLVDIADEAEKIYIQMISKERLKSSTISRLKQMQSKIISFMFMYKEAVVLADAIKYIIDNVPNGSITNPRDVSVLQQWFCFMSDVNKLSRIISGEEKVADWLSTISHAFNSASNNDTPVTSKINDNPFAKVTVLGNKESVNSPAAKAGVSDETKGDVTSDTPEAPKTLGGGLSLNGW